MKHSLFRSLTIVCSILAIALFGGSLLAQGNANGVGYRVFWPELPPEWTREAGSIWVQDFAFKTDSNGTPVVALVVGYYYRTDRVGSTGFVYDHFGLIDPNQPQKFWDLLELIGGSLPNWVPPTLDKHTAIRGVNSNGRICGQMTNGESAQNSDSIGFYIDLTDPVLEMKQLPDFYTTAIHSFGLKVSELGDILLVGSTGDTVWQQAQVSIYNPELDHLIHIRKNQTEPFLFSGDYEHLAFNSGLELLGELPGDAFSSRTVKHRVNENETDANGIGLSYTDSGVTNFENEDYFYPTGINEYSQFGCRALLNVRRNRKEYHAARIGSDGSVEWSLRDSSRRVDDINNSGDLVYGQHNETPQAAFYFHEGDPNIAGDETFIEDFFQLVIPESDPGGLFQHNGPTCLLSDRDSTGFGWIAGLQLSPDGSPYRTLFLLIPEVPTSTPGISIAPTTGLTTTEGGGTDSFDVVLDAEPTADVTIGINSSNVYEGTVDQASLTFTPVNWDIPQTVTITGVDDPFEDGDVAYTIVTAAATSTDPEYDALDADDVLVTNLDDEGPSVVVYNSVDTPLAIPDNDAGGVASDIVAGDHTIANLTVNVNIAHQRPSDLEVYLVGPDGGPPVQLLNFSGDNVVADFNGDSSLGLWTLEVYDTRIRKTGSLNSWSITVDY
jgi:hypothetical protein